MRLRNTGRDRAHSHFGYQLDRDVRIGARVLQIENELG